MTNVQQPEMRRNEHNPTVQDSKRPEPGNRVSVSEGETRAVPADQASPYGPRPRRVAAGHDEQERSD